MLQKNTDLTLEITKELDDTKCITSGDALDALRLAVGLPTQAGTQLQRSTLSAADFNRDGKVTSCRRFGYSQICCWSANHRAVGMGVC